MINNTQLKEIIEDLILVCKETNIRPSDSSILEQSCSYQRGFMINANRTIKEQVTTPAPTQRKATEKQIALLKKNGIHIPDSLSIEEAKQMISTYFNNLKEKNI